MGQEFLSTLYKRTKTGAIQVWSTSIGIEGVWYTHSGQLEGKFTRHTKTAKGKNLGKSNATTAGEQARRDATSDWNSKHDEGYKSLEDLNIVGNTAGRALTDALELSLPQFNSDASGNVKPMLAPSKPWKAGDKKNKYPQRMEPKLDGVRSTIVITKVTKTQSKGVVVEILSRSGKPYQLIHLSDTIFMASSIFPEGKTILDGEIYKHGWTLQEINRAVKKYRPGVTEQLEFWMYDLPLLESDQVSRSIRVSSLVERINSSLIKTVDAITVQDDYDVLHYHNSMVNDGYEGGMLKQFEGTYQPGQRSSFWTKVKMFDEDEYEIVEWELGERGVEDLIFICKSPKGSTSGPTFKVKMKGSTASKQELVGDMKNIIGKPLTVKHFGFTEYGIPNLPIGKTIRDYE